jgi:tetratricopeptide (TPR) repeat protein
MLRQAESAGPGWIGRETELQIVDSVLEELGRGYGGVVVLTGEPGIGKTRLADEVAHRARARGLAVHWGRAWEVAGAPPYWLFAQLMRSMSRHLPVDALEDLTGPHRVALADLLPELRHRLAIPSTARRSRTRDRVSLYDGVTAFLRAATARAPQVLILDDLHAADPSTLHLLQLVVLDARSNPMLIIGTHRDAEARLSPDVGPLLFKIAREATVLPLRRFDENEVAAFLEQATRTPTTVATARRVHERTEGNPLFLTELIRLGAESAAADGTQEIVRARLALMPADTRRVLEAAAVLGREFALDPLANLVAVSDTTASEKSSLRVHLAQLLTPALQGSIIEPLEEAARWRFTHVLLRERLYNDLPGSRRSSLHAAAACELGQRLGGAPPTERAHHLLQAVSEVGIDVAAEAAIAAARYSMDLLAFENADLMLERALDLIESEGGDDRQRFEVLLVLGVARIRAARVDLGKETCRRAVSLARTLGDGDLFARAVLGCTDEFTPGIRDVEAVALLEEALERLPTGDGAIRARCMAQLACERQPEPDNRECLDLARAAVAMARRTGDTEALRFALVSAGLAMVHYADPVEQISVNREVLRLAGQTGDKLAEGRAHLFLSSAYWQLGDLAGVLSHVRSHERLASESRHPVFRWPAQVLSAGMAVWEGRFAEAKNLYVELCRIAQADPARGVTMLAFPVGLHRAAEWYEDLPVIESELRAGFAQTRDPLLSCIGEMLIAQLYSRAGNRQRAAAVLESVRAHPAFNEITEPSWLVLLAEPCHLLDDIDLARRLYPVLLPRAHQFVFLGPMTAYCDPPYGRELGLLSATLGELDESVEHLTSALARMKEVGMRSHLARVSYDLAGVLISRGRSSDRQLARDLLRDALGLAQSLGQDGLLPHISARSQELGLDDAVLRSEKLTGAPFSLQRKDDFWALSWEDETVRLRDTRGLHVLARLVANPGQEFHVLELVSPGSRVDGGDAGPLIDKQAEHAYRKRIVDLREELEVAEGFNDVGRAERLRVELEALSQELARAVGLGGRERRGSSATERARTTVQKRLRAAIERIEQHLPVLAHHLSQCVRTGTMCSYHPDGKPRGRSPTP